MLGDDKEHDVMRPGGRSGSLPRGPRWTTALGVWALVFLGVWALARPQQPAPLHDPHAKPREVAPRVDLPVDERGTISVFKKASLSIAYITNVEYRRTIFSLNVFEIPQGTGSGFIWDDQGHIVTNYHVIAGADAIEVTLADQSSWPADFVGADADKDLAVIKIDAPDEVIKPITVGTSNDLQVGQKVLAIGNPFGLDNTLTTGVVSALGREIESVTGRAIRGVIQTDAAINPGNSGGPLLDSAGRLIGVNTQIASPSGASAGISFAVPVDTVNEIVPEIIRYGRFRRAGLGITAVEDWQTRRLGIRGILIANVSPDTGAHEAGLRGTTVNRRGMIHTLGDIIIKIGGRDVQTLNDLKDALEPHKPGTSVEVTYIRNSKPQTTSVKLQYIN